MLSSRLTGQLSWTNNATLGTSPNRPLNCSNRILKMGNVCLLVYKKLQVFSHIFLSGSVIRVRVCEPTFLIRVWRAARATNKLHWQTTKNTNEVGNPYFYLNRLVKCKWMCSWKKAFKPAVWSYFHMELNFIVRVLSSQHQQNQNIFGIQ